MNGRLPAALSDAAVLEAVALAQAGDVGARNAVIGARMRLVIAEAGRAAQRSRRYDLFDDLVQAGAFGTGNGGLVRAIASFDVRGKTPFTAWALRWIRAAQQAVLRETAPGIERRQREVRAVVQRLAADLGRDPTLTEVCAEHARTYHDSDHRVSEASAERYLAFNAIPVELEDHGDGTTEGDVAAALDTARQLRALAPALDVLTPTERVIIASRYGIGDAERRTLIAIGAELGVSRQRVKQLEARALRKLRAALDVRAGA